MCNVDETGVSTVLIPHKIVALKGRKQVGLATFAERGEIITVSVFVAVNALENSLVLIFIFTRKIIREHFIVMGPHAAVELGTDQGGEQKRHLSLL
jgi:hypothetical protein